MPSTRRQFFVRWSCLPVVALVGAIVPIGCGQDKPSGAPVTPDVQADNARNKAMEDYMKNQGKAATTPKK